MSRLVLIVLLVSVAACGDSPTTPTPPNPAATNVTAPESKNILFEAVATGGYAEFRKNGKSFYRKGGGADGGRGFNVARISLTTGELLDPVQNFDTWGTSLHFQDLNAYLKSTPSGTLILMAVADEAGLNKWDSCEQYTYETPQSFLRLIRQMGSTLIDSYCYRDRWSMIVIKDGEKKDEQVTKFLVDPPALSSTSITLP